MMDKKERNEKWEQVYINNEENECVDMRRECKGSSSTSHYIVSEEDEKTFFFCLKYGFPA